MIRFFKYHGLGNDYLVLDPDDCKTLPSEDRIQIICHRNYGLGSDGILYGPLSSESGDFRLQILNPDGGEAEKSGNGLRIFARYLFDTGRVSEEPFTVETLGGVVTCQVDPRANLITVEMGQVTFASEKIPVTGDAREVLNESIDIQGTAYTYYAASIGNPHCVLPMEEISAELAKRIGPEIEHDPRFPRRTNVQLLKVLDEANIQIEIWERGAGYTLASGSSSSAAGAVARKMGSVGPDVTVHMPGGQIRLQIDDDFNITMTGPATRVALMELDEEAVNMPLPEGA